MLFSREKRNLVFKILMFFSLLRQVLESYRKREEEAVANIDFEHLEDFRRRQSVGLFG